LDADPNIGTFDALGLEFSQQSGPFQAKSMGCFSSHHLAFGHVTDNSGAPQQRAKPRGNQIN